MSLQAISAHPDFFEKSPLERMQNVLRESSARYECQDLGRGRRARDLSERFASELGKLSAFMRYEGSYEGVICLELQETGEERLHRAKGPTLFLTYEEGWTLETASREEMTMMAWELQSQLRDFGIRASRGQLIGQLKRLCAGRQVTKLADFFK